MVPLVGGKKKRHLKNGTFKCTGEPGSIEIVAKHRDAS